MSAPDQEYRLPDGGPSIAALPKVSLHDHLDGGLRPSTILELADEAGIALPASDATGLTEWFASAVAGASLVDYLKRFDVTNAVMQTAPALRRVAHEFVLDLAADGVIHGEVRWGPSLHTRGGLSLDEAVEAVQAGFDDATRDLAERGHHVGVGQILCALRNESPVASLEIAQLALRHRVGEGSGGVLGFDIAGPEAGFPPAAHREAFDLLQAEFLPVTVHAGEADGLTSIRGALIDGHALRLGHGVRIADDISILRDTGDATTVGLGPIATWVRDREIALELSPTSNLQTGAFASRGDDFDDHPFDLLYQLGFRVTVNTDNRLMSATSLSRELALLAQAFDYGLDDFERFQQNAAASAFLPLEERDALADRIALGFAEA
ncbi:adenosine deaminase [Frondihabitans australicus]|uniref:adenosine deaminase n=1 Tax=Frondihabitans australicus TaxID=386892 RepID=A0A495IBA0_9MICO|nr:adenosine deaminase [Frondihabitans australicus]RKR73202.1 adenosine deaminase [Frondihabitans australicus]